MTSIQDKLQTLRRVVALVEAARSLRGVRVDDVLARVGLERRTSAADPGAQWLGGFAAGLIAGGTAGLLLAPMEGRALRDRLRHEIGKMREAWIGYDQHADARPGGFDHGGRRNAPAG